MNPLTGSETAIESNSKLEWDHDTVNGIINGYFGWGLFKKATQMDVTSDQVTDQVAHNQKGT